MAQTPAKWKKPPQNLKKKQAASEQSDVVACAVGHAYTGAQNLKEQLTAAAGAAAAAGAGAAAAVSKYQNNIAKMKNFC